MGFHKFDWMRAVAADTRIPGGEKFVLCYCAAIYVRYGEDTFCVRQETIAARCATSERTVRTAIRHACWLGYLQLAQLRQFGRGHHRANECRLQTPEDFAGLLTPEEFAGLGEETPEADARNTGSRCTETPEAADSSTSESDTPEGLYKGFREGYGGAAAAAPQPINNDEENPAADYTAALLPAAFPGPEAQHPNRWDAIANCNLCDEFGWLLGPDGAVADRAIPCTHEGDGR